MADTSHPALRPGSSVQAAALVVIGTFLMLAALVVNPWTVGLWAADGVINSRLVRAAVLALEVAAIVGGLGLILKRRTIDLKKVLLIPVSVAAGLLMITLTCEVVCSPQPVKSGWRATYGGTLERNQLGFRGHPIAFEKDEQVILLVGDSHVEAAACAFDYMPERRLEHHLRAAGKRVKVFSLAAGGWGQDQQLLALPEYFAKYRADLVVLWQTPENDVWNNVWPTHWPGNGPPKPTFWLEGDALRGPTEAWEAQVTSSSLNLLAMIQPRLPALRFRDALWARRLPPSYQPMDTYDGPVNTTWQRYWDEDTGYAGSMRWEDFNSEKSHFTIRLTPRSERTTYGLDLTRRLMQEMESLARRHGAELLVIGVEGSTSDHYQDGVYVLNGKYYRISESQLRENIAYVNQGLAFQRIQVSLEHPRVGPYDPHFNEHATDDAMMQLARAIQDRFD